MSGTGAHGASPAGAAVTDGRFHSWPCPAEQRSRRGSWRHLQAPRPAQMPPCEGSSGGAASHGPQTAPCSVGAERQKRITAFASQLNTPDVWPRASWLRQAVTSSPAQPSEAEGRQGVTGRCWAASLQARPGPHGDRWALLGHHQPDSFLRSAQRTRWGRGQRSSRADFSFAG